MNNYQVLLFYKYREITEPEKVKVDQLKLCEKLNLKGRIIIAKEGINVTLEGLNKDIEKYVEHVKKDFKLEASEFKKSAGTGKAFPKLSVKVRPEIVSSHLGEADLNPNRVTGKYLYPEELHMWFKENKKFYIVDMRNDYEHEIGYFENSLLAPFKNFRDLPKIIEKIPDLKNETILTVCTGGVRCEKASGFLVNSGFKNVYQLYGGIVSYMEKYPNENFLGNLYVFDGRVALRFNTVSPEHKIVGRCVFCSSPADTYIDCKYIHCKNERHFVSCSECLIKFKGYCKVDSNYSQIRGLKI